MSENSTKTLPIKFNSQGDLICGVKGNICHKQSDEIYPCYNCKLAAEYLKGEIK